MSIEKPSSISDAQSEMSPRRGRPPVPRSQVLHAAESLFADAQAPGSVSMDDIAAAAGVGKATLFRAFGNRDGLLDALFATQLDPLKAELEREGSSIGPNVPPGDRVLAILQLLLEFKLKNPRLTAARELSGPSLLRAPHYVWVHGLLSELIDEAGSKGDVADYSAHVLLGGLRAELIQEVLESGGTIETFSRNLLGIARQILATSTE